MVVSIESLDCFDFLIWLRSGAAAAERLDLTQPTVSRNVQTVSKLFNITAQKTDGEWEILGDTTLLNLERQVHQKYRWALNLPLRLEAQFYSGPLFCNQLPKGWRVGNFDFLQIHTPLQHLQTGVIDAWIGCYPDVPEPNDKDFSCFDLTRLPTHLVVAPDHPLVALGDSLTLNDIKEYPFLVLPDKAFPKVQAALEDLGLWNLNVKSKRYSPNYQNKISSGLAVNYATCLTIDFFDTPQVVLPLYIPLEVGDTLIVRHEYADHPRLQELLNYLKGKALQIAERFPEVHIP